MDYGLLSGIGSCLLTGQGSAVNPYLSGSYLTNPYLSGLYSSGLVSGAGISGVFQSGVRFGQALEKAAGKNPESAEQLQKILEEAFGSQGSGKTTKSSNVRNNSVAAVYEPSRGNTARTGVQLGDYLAGRRSSRAQQRQEARQH